VLLDALGNVGTRLGLDDLEGGEDTDMGMGLVDALRRLPPPQAQGLPRSPPTSQDSDLPDHRSPPALRPPQRCRRRPSSPLPSPSAPRPRPRPLPQSSASQQPDRPRLLDNSHRRPSPSSHQPSLPFLSSLFLPLFLSCFPQKLTTLTFSLPSLLLQSLHRAPGQVSRS
jgi:hypothetical protein